MTRWLDALPPGGEMGIRLREHPWERTPLGPVAEWPDELCSAVGTALTSRFPMLVIWGPELVQVYNDAFVPIFAEKHPQIGRRVCESWAEIWDVIGPMMRGVVETREAIWAEDQLFWIDRVGLPEDTYFTFSYSPILDRSGTARGLLVTAVETTAGIVEARRMRVIQEVGAQQTTDLDTAARRAAEAIGRHPEDVPCALVYLRGEDGGHRLAGSAGIAADRSAALAAVPPGAEHPWPLDRAAAEPLVLPGGVAPAGKVEHALSGRPVRDVALVRLGGHGTLVAGLSPTRRIDDGLRSFLGLLGTQLEGALAVANAIETEQARVDELLALDRAKNTFFANVSHELRTPVSLMLAPLADALRDARFPLPEVQRARVDLAHRNAARLVALVDDVLDFTRAEAAQQELRLERVRIGERTRELAAAFAETAVRAGLALEVSCPEPVREAWVDPRIWERIVLNLISNAVKYTPQGRISVRLHDHGDRVRLEVADTGVGIPEAELEHVFERFYRVPGAEVRTSEGAGIGLALVRRLVELHGGEIGVRSTLGEGSCFWVELPVAAGGAGGEVPAAAAPLVDRAAIAAGTAAGWFPAAEDGPRNGGPAQATDERPRVLIADDNADMRAYIADVLAEEFTVRVAPDGAAALRVAREDHPDLVLTDVMMPGLDGFALLRELRADPATAAVPVVMLSARAADEAVLEGLDAGADEYLLKPFSSAELVARVRSTIALTRARAALERAAAEREADLRLIRAEARYRHAGRAARVGTWSMDLVTGALEVDENLAEMFGVPSATLTSLEACLEYVLPEDRERVVRELDAVGSEAGETIHEYRLQRPDGTRRVLQWRASATVDEDGRPLELFGAAWDATALADAQAAIRETEQAAPAGIAIVELDGRVSRVNRALSELVGRSAEELSGTPVSALVHPDDDLGLDGEATTTSAREIRLVDATGEAIWVTVSSAPVRGADGTLRHFVVHVQDARERKRFEHELQYLAEHDALTDLWNRRRFGEEVERALADAQRHGHTGALVLLDLDGLKHLNDTLGHAVGDDLLVAVADVLRGRLRATDVAARLGGDEFAVLAPHVDEAAAGRLTAELLDGIGRVGPLASGVGAGSVTASAGIAMYGDHHDVTGGEDLLIEADVALYEAKEAGRGQFRLRLPGSAPIPGSSRHPRWSVRIRRALETDAFVLHAQPIVALNGAERLARGELLLRMRGEHGDLLAPSVFLPTAERSGLVQDIDRWVVHAAVRELAARARAGEDCAFAVNLSAKSIVDPGMARFVVDEIDAAGADGSRLVVEVTESSAIVNLERARDFVRTIRDRGCRLALDDFGAGFTSFHYLRHLEFDLVKIDGAFIQDLATDPTNQSLVRALGAMAHSLGKRTVAECVGDDRTVDWLRRHGVDYAQGYHLGRPVPLEEFR